MVSCSQDSWSKRKIPLTTTGKVTRLGWKREFCWIGVPLCPVRKEDVINYYSVKYFLCLPAWHEKHSDALTEKSLISAWYERYSPVFKCSHEYNSERDCPDSCRARDTIAFNLKWGDERARLRHLCRGVLHFLKYLVTSVNAVQSGNWLAYFVLCKIHSTD